MKGLQPFELVIKIKPGSKFQQQVIGDFLTAIAMAVQLFQGRHKDNIVETHLSNPNEKP